MCNELFEAISDAMYLRVHGLSTISKQKKKRIILTVEGGAGGVVPKRGGPGAQGWAAMGRRGRGALLRVRGAGPVPLMMGVPHGRPFGRLAKEVLLD